MISKKDKLIKGASLVLLILFFFSLDQISKNYFLGSGFYVKKNYGIAFGLFQNDLVARFFYLCLTILVVVWILKRNEHRASVLSILSSGLLLGGAFGNWFDYFSRGYVVDPLSLSWLLPVWSKTWASYFNLADVFIVMGLLLLAVGTGGQWRRAAFPGENGLSR